MPREAIFEASVNYFLAPIGPFLADDSVTEIMVNGCDREKVQEPFTSLTVTAPQFS